MLDGTVAFVTGASRGIGRSIAETLVERGASVALAARSDDIFALGDELGDGTLAVETDVADAESVRESIEATVREFGGLDCLVNNAGVAGPTAPIEEVSEDAWKETLDVNVSGGYRTVKYAAPSLRESERGCIVNIASISGKRPLENRSPYATSKMAVIGLTRTLAVEFGTDDVTVNAICPGPTEGPRLDDVLEKQAEKTGRSVEDVEHDLVAGATTLGTAVAPSDIASLVAYLASEEGRHITAQDINVDAGSIWY